MASKTLSSSARLGCQIGGLSAAGSRWGQGRPPVCCSGSGYSGCTQGPALPKDHFRGALSVGVSSKGASEWDEK